MQALLPNIAYYATTKQKILIILVLECCSLVSQYQHMFSCTTLRQQVNFCQKQVKWVRCILLISH